MQKFIKRITTRIVKNKTFDDYLRRFSNFHLNKHIQPIKNIEELKPFTTYWLINDEYYRAPRITYKSGFYILASLALLAAILTPIIYVNCFQTFGVTLIGDHVHNKGAASIKRNTTYKTTLDIDYNYELNLKDINVYVNNKLNNDCWTFLYQTNIKNEFIINGSAVTGSITIEANAKWRESHGEMYGCACDVPNTEITFSPSREKMYIPDWQRMAYPVFEDDEVKMTIYSTNDQPLPENIGMWMNGRFVKHGDELFMTYSSDKKTCETYIPRYIVRDNILFKTES